MKVRRSLDGDKKIWFTTFRQSTSRLGLPETFALIDCSTRQNRRVCNTTGQQNVAAGRSALYYNTTGSNNTAIGYSALEANTIGQNNTGICYSAFRGNLARDANTAVGQSAVTMPAAT